jgi:hypothetical protein
VLLFLFPFLTTRVNPDVGLGFLGLVIALLGGLVLAANSFRMRVQPRGIGLVFAIAGWATLSAGLLISLAGFLLGSQVICGCPASPAPPASPVPCDCFVTLYNLMLYGGFYAALVGGASIVAGAVVSKSRPIESAPPKAGTRIGKKTAVALAIALSVAVVFSLFSYWPGVYITSVNEQTQFVGGMPLAFGPQNPSGLPLMTSPISSPTSGFRLPVGGNFTYILHFNSVSSYQKYRIDSISLTNGFTIASTNASLPLVISPANPSVSISFNIRGPYYPSYGPVSFFLRIQNLNDSGL